MMEPNTTDKPQRSATDERGSWAYPSQAASGHVEVEVPSLPGSPRPTESLHARDFGVHVAGAVERSLRGNPYKSGPQQGPAEVLNHYIAVAKGAKLVDERTLGYMERLVKEFAAEEGEHRQTYYRTMVRSFLASLKPERRKK